MKQVSLLSLLFVTFLIVSCGSSVENEENKWNSNLQRLETLSAKYPNFKGAFTKVREEAENSMIAAKAVSDEKSKITAMSAANKVASPDFVIALDDFDNKVNSIRDLMTKAAQMGGDHNDQNAAWTAKNAAEQAISEAQSSIRYANANTPSEADAVLGTVISNLNAAEKRLNNVISTAEGKKQEEKNKQDEEAKKKEDEKKAEEKKNMAVKCGHCGTMNDPKSATCSSCGAPMH